MWELLFLLQQFKGLDTSLGSGNCPEIGCKKLSASGVQAGSGEELWTALEQNRSLQLTPPSYMNVGHLNWEDLGRGAVFPL